MTDYLGRIKSEEKQLEPEDPNLEEMMTHFPLKLAAKKIAQYQKELKEILFELSKNETSLGIADRLIAGPLFSYPSTKRTTLNGTEITLKE